MNETAAESILPDNWQVMYRILDTIASQASSSPVITRDLQILHQLECVSQGPDLYSK